MTRKELEALGYSLEVTSHSYFVRHNSNGLGGGATRGTATHTSDGRRRHWKHIAADRKMFEESAIRIATDHYRKSLEPLTP